MQGSLFTAGSLEHRFKPTEAQTRAASLRAYTEHLSLTKDLLLVKGGGAMRVSQLEGRSITPSQAGMSAAVTSSSPLLEL